MESLLNRRRYISNELQPAFRQIFKINSPRFPSRADFLIKFYRRGVPIEATPFQVGVSVVFYGFYKFVEKFFAETTAAAFGFYV